MNSVSISKSNKLACSFSFVVFKVLTRRITSANWFWAAISLLQIVSPNSLTPNSSIQSGMDWANFLVLDNSSNLPLIRLVGVLSKYFQSGNLIPLRVAQTANNRQELSLAKGSFTSAISA